VLYVITRRWCRSLQAGDLVEIDRAAAEREGATHERSLAAGAGPPGH
jgi:hypothetical protein